MRKFVVLTTLIIVLAFGIFFWWRFYHPFSDNGVKVGYINKIEHKGYIFKTWEGTLIQTGFKSATPGSVQSPTFEFSVTDDNVAQQLQGSNGKIVTLRYKQYLGKLPWRGFTNYVVDSVYIDNNDNTNTRPGL